MAFPTDEIAFPPLPETVITLFPGPDPYDSACPPPCSSCLECIWLREPPSERLRTGAIVLSSREDDEKLALVC